MTADKCKSCIHRGVCYSHKDKFRLPKITEFGFYTKRYSILSNFDNCVHYKSEWNK